MTSHVTPMMNSVVTTNQIVKSIKSVHVLKIVFFCQPRFFKAVFKRPYFAQFLYDTKDFGLIL